VTKDSARVRARFVGDPVLRVSSAADLSGAIELAATEDSAGVRTFELTGLSPSTRYYYAAGEQPIASLKTFSDGPAAISIAFGSCAETGSEHAVFSAISDRDPDLFVHLGDMHYENIADDDVGRYREAIGQVFGSSVQANLYANTPLAYVWDDHDFGPNDSNRSSPSHDAACRAYRELVPHYPLASSEAIHQAFTIGGARVVLLDARSERRPGETMLGSAQLAWFFEELERSSRTHSLVIVGSTVSFIGDGDDSWGGFASEREGVARFVRERSIENLVMISGDAHMAAFDDGRNNSYAGSSDPSFPVMFASAFDKPGSTKGGPYSSKPIEGRGHFGLLELEDDGRSPVKLTFTARDSRDRELLRHELQFPQRGPRFA
jgi:phosphodiesterase/alkaline phosphatase D-like protein